MTKELLEDFYNRLQTAWGEYTNNFGERPHGTIVQIRTMGHFGLNIFLESLWAKAEQEGYERGFRAGQNSL